VGRKSKKPIQQDKKALIPRALTNTQYLLLEAIKTKPMVVVTGPAGTGKTYLATAYAAYLFDNNLIDKIIITRPTVPTGRSIGFFPGDLDEKMEPWVRPFLEILEEILTKTKVELMRKSGQIETIPFETIRGRTFNNAFVILDEAQNCTQLEMKAFVTRQGEESTVVINGDITQSDLNGSGNGLDLIVSIYKKSKVLQEFVSHIEFSDEDIVRSGICQAWVREFSKVLK